MDALLSNRLTELAARITAHLANIRENLLPLCVDLAEARAKFADNTSFSKWLDAASIKLNHQDRAAAITMGEDPKRLKAVLAVTDRTSIQLIYEKEFRVTSASKNNPGLKPPAKVTPQQERAAHVIERRVQAGEPVDEKSVREEAGVSSTPYRRAKAVHDAVVQVEVETQTTLSATAQEKLDAAMRSHKKQLDLAFETAVAREAKKRMEEISLPAYFATLKEVEALLNSPRWAVMSVADFKKILACLHPDNARPGHEERFAEAFALFNKYRPKMVDEKSEKEEADRLKRVRLSGVPLPQSVAEMMARKKTRK